MVEKLDLNEKKILNWKIFSENRDVIYGIAIISIMIFHYVEDCILAGAGGRLLSYIVD